MLIINYTKRLNFKKNNIKSVNNNISYNIHKFGSMNNIQHIIMNKSVIQLIEILSLKHSKRWINLV